MKKIIIALVLLLLLTVIANVSCNNAGAGKSTPDQVTLKIGSFNAIQLYGGYEVELIQGNEESVTIETDHNLLKNIKTEIEKGKLIINCEKGFQFDKVKLTIRFIDIFYLEINGGMKLRSELPIQIKDLEMVINGGADIKIPVNGNTIGLNLSGGTNVKFTGKVTNLNVDLSGAGNISCDELEAENVDVEIGGAGYAIVWATKSIKANLSGVGVIEYLGNPSTVKSNVSGIGSVKRKE
jgi:hypothetical protein